MSWPLGIYPIGIPPKPCSSADFYAAAYDLFFFLFFRFFYFDVCGSFTLVSSGAAAAAY